MMVEYDGAGKVLQSKDSKIEDEDENGRSRESSSSLSSASSEEIPLAKLKAINPPIPVYHHQDLFQPLVKEMTRRDSRINYLEIELESMTNSTEKLENQLKAEKLKSKYLLEEFQLIKKERDSYKNENDQLKKKLQELQIEYDKCFAFLEKHKEDC